MIQDPVEVAELISSTRDLIDGDPTPISLIRETWTRTPAGGTIRNDNPTTLSPVVRYFGGITSDPLYVTRDEGEHVLIRHVIVGMPGDDIQAKDRFRVDDREFEVVQMHPERTWQVKGWVVERSPNG